jgi:peroxiredoxin
MKVKMIFLIVLIALTGSAMAQNPVSVGQAMPDFKLMSHDGNEVSLSQFKGKNVLIMFARGKVGDHWCQICHYKYAELADMDKQQKIRKKYDLEILYVLPYSLEEIKHWVDIFPGQMTAIDGWKNPTDPDNLSPGMKSWMKRARAYFPNDYKYEEGKVEAPFPVLADADQALSKQLGLYTLNWDRSYVEQNISTLYLVDKEGIVQFKYHSQTTFDRPSADYIIKFIDRMLE